MQTNQPSLLKPWQPGQPIEAARLQALQDRAILSLHVGPGLKVLRNGNSVTIALGEQEPSPRVFVGVLRIVSLEAGAEKYGVQFGNQQPSNDQIDPATDTVAADLPVGFGSSTAEALGINIAGIDGTGAATTHSLAADGEPILALAIRGLNPATDGRIVYYFQAIQGGC